MDKKPFLVTSGEPAGVGPDICLALAAQKLPVVVVGDKELLRDRAKQLGYAITFHDYQPDIVPKNQLNHLTVLSIPCLEKVVPGQLNSMNAAYVVEMLTTGLTRCLSGEFAGLITAPVHKAIINQAGFTFSGHTEFFAEACHVKTVVMMLMCDAMKVALLTTHLPLKDVPNAITADLITDVIRILHTGLQRDFSMKNPLIYVAGLNPHAGEGGYLGREEIDVITPCIIALQQEGINVQGPFSADTLFTMSRAKTCDAFLAMYHDQGLPVLKYAGFGQAVNVTLGLPIIRTSVDHGTALELAGSGLAESGSLLAAVNTAMTMFGYHR